MGQVIFRARRFERGENSVNEKRSGKIPEALYSKMLKAISQKPTASSDNIPACMVPVLLHRCTQPAL